MNTSGINAFNGVKGITNSSPSTPKKSSGNSELDNFSTVQYTSKKDGETYIAKKITLTQGDEEVTGIYVFNKNAKPDENGDIKGEFMNFETFMKKLSDELPAVSANTVSAYHPNIKTMSPEEKFDKAFDSGVKLSDGAVLLRPIMMNTGSTEIKPSKKDGNYDVISTSFVGGYKHEPSIRTLTEQQLMEDKGLCNGTLKKTDDGKYELTYYTDTKFNQNYETTTKVLDKSECMEFLRNNCLYL